MVLYKYLSSQYADAFLHGKILFRNLSYFKRQESQNRGDATEGIHRDKPESGITIEHVSTNKTLSGNFTFLNEIDSDLVFVFCTSEVFDNALFDAFEADCCVEIFNPEGFAKLIRREVMSLLSTNKSVGLLSGSAKYYDQRETAGFNIKDPKDIVFAKDIRYAHQKEFRFAFGRGRKSFSLCEAIVSSQHYDFREAAKAGTKDEMTLLIGSINDIARIHPGSPCLMARA